MSDIVLVAIITGGFGLITMFVNRWFKKMDEKLDQYHKAVNGKMDELLQVTGEAEKAKGVKEGRDELKNEQKDIDNNKV